MDIVRNYGGLCGNIVWDFCVLRREKGAIWLGCGTYLSILRTAPMDYEAWKGDRSGGVGCLVCAVSDLRGFIQRKMWEISRLTPCRLVHLHY